MSKEDNPIWSIERALQHGYVMEPHVPSGNFSGPLRMTRPSHDCALQTAAISRNMRDPAMKDRNWDTQPACEKQCDECSHICHMNDYIRGKAHCPPHYPVPAIERCTIGTGRAYGPEHGPNVTMITLWDADDLAYKQWSHTEGDAFITFWCRNAKDY